MPTDYESQQISEIELWMNHPPDILSRVADGVLAPGTGLVARVVPEGAILAALDLGNAAGQTLSRYQSIKKHAGVSHYSELLRSTLEECDRLAATERHWAMGLAAAEGALTGAAGIHGLPLDIPAVVAMAMRAIHTTGLCYGFELKSDGDRQLAVAILSASGANNMKEKVAALAYLKNLNARFAKEAFERMAAEANESAFSQQAVMLTAKALAEQLGMNFARRKLAQAVPFLGAGIGATVNAWYLHDVCHAARRTFQERWLRANGVLHHDIGPEGAPGIPGAG
jgi:phosphohistidine swiveling domain-containing protein